MSAELALSYLFMFEVGDVCGRGFRVGLVADVQDGLDQPFMTIVSSQWRDKSLPPFMEPLALQPHPFPRFHHVRPTRIDSQKSTLSMSPSSCPKYNQSVTDDR